MLLKDSIKNGIIYALGAVVFALAFSTWLNLKRAEVAAGERDVARQQRDNALGANKRMADGVELMNKLAAAKLRALNASVLAVQKQLDASRELQEKKDAQGVQVADGYRRDLRAARLQLDEARRAARGAAGGGGGSASGDDPIGAFARAGGGAEARRLLPEAPTGAGAEGDADAYDADIINLAYASCRADALSIRAGMKKPPAGG